MIEVSMNVYAHGIDSLVNDSDIEVQPLLMFMLHVTLSQDLISERVSFTKKLFEYIK